MELVSGTAVSTAADADRTGEGELVERAAGGDRAAQEALIRRYLPDVYRVTYRLLGDRELAEDAAQDAFVNMLHALPRFRGDASFRTWLLRIAANAAHSQGRRRTRRREQGLESEPEVTNGEPDAAVLLEQRSEADRIERAMARLPAKQRLAVSLRIQQGLSYAEIAAATDSTEGAARVNYHLGVKRLRELLQ